MILVTLSLAAAILILGGSVGAFYLAVGSVSLVLDWFLFYDPYFDEDRKSMTTLVSETYAGVSKAESARICDHAMQYMKWQILRVQIESLPWWILTSWRWIFASDKDYRKRVGLAYTTAVLNDPIMWQTMK
jgi:hypothetical protein